MKISFTTYVLIMNWKTLRKRLGTRLKGLQSFSRCVTMNSEKITLLEKLFQSALPRACIMHCLYTQNV